MERVNLILDKKDNESAKKKALKIYGCKLLSPLVRHLIKNFLREKEKIKEK